MKLAALPEEEFWSEYNKAFTKANLVSEADEDAFRDRIFSLQEALVKALATCWKEDKDFHIGHDYDLCRHVCGGVYSGKTICSRFLNLVREALAADAEPECWTFHVAVESQRLDGQFFVRADSVIFPDTGPDFSRLLQRRIAIW